MWVVQALVKKYDLPEQREQALQDLWKQLREEEASCLVDLKRVASKQDELFNVDKVPAPSSLPRLSLCIKNHI